MHRIKQLISGILSIIINSVLLDKSPPSKPVAPT